jgi:hypothetical protein
VIEHRFGFSFLSRDDCIAPKAAIEKLDKCDILPVVSKMKERLIMELRTANLTLRPSVPQTSKISLT